MKKLLISLLIFELIGCNSDTSSNIGDLASSNGSLSCEPRIELEEQMVTLINQARSESRSCGGQLFNAADPIRWNSELEKAAQKHSNDMASNNFFSHQGSDGTDASNRIQNQGYSWTTYGENIFAGAKNTEAAIDGWLASSGHCQNIMNPNFTEMGAACIKKSKTKYGTYHTQVFGHR